MPDGFFTDKTAVPSETELYTLLSAAAAQWRQIEQDVVQGTTTAEWKFYTKKTGWIRVIRKGKRTLFYMLPEANAFSVTFVFGDRAMEAVLASGVAQPLKDSLLAAIPYMEGRSLAMQIQQAADLQDFARLLAIKEAG